MSRATPQSALLFVIAVCAAVVTARAARAVNVQLLQRWGVFGIVIAIIALLLQGCVSGGLYNEWQPGRMHPDYPKIGTFSPRGDVVFKSQFRAGSQPDNLLRRAIRDFNKTAGKDVAFYCRERCGFTPVVVRQMKTRDAAGRFGGFYRDGSGLLVINPRSVSYRLFLHEVTHAMGFPHTRVKGCLMSIPYSSVHQFCEMEKRIIRTVYGGEGEPAANIPGVALLHEAVKSGNSAEVEARIKAGDDINARAGKWRYTPLHWAARNEELAAMSVLIAAGADINARGGVRKGRDKQYTPLHLAIQKSRSLAVVALVKAGADVNSRGGVNDDGEYWQYTPLHSAVARNRTWAVNILLEAGADVNAREKDGYTPLHAAAEYARGHITRILMEAGADVNVKGKDGLTPLHAAARKGNASIINILVSAGAHVNAQDKWQSLPLHWAADNGHLKATEKLIKAGARINAKDHKNRTPLDMAKAKGHKDVVDALLKAGAVEGKE